MPERRHDRGILDTSVVIDATRLGVEALPGEAAISTVTLAELAAGPHATDDPGERSLRQQRLQSVESAFDRSPSTLTWRAPSAGSTRRSARQVNGPGVGAARPADRSDRAGDGPAAVHRNAEDFSDLETLIEVVVVERRAPGDRPRHRSRPLAGAGHPRRLGAGRARARATRSARPTTPVFDELWERYPHTTLSAGGRDVGLPDGQMGNSEVGHLNLGAGAVVKQDLARIDDAVADGSFFENEVAARRLRRPRGAARAGACT